VLIDFGSARRPHPGESTELTAIVSRGYAPFEQYDAGNEQRQGPWTDIYSMAATLYHAITGAPPTDALARGMSMLDGEPDPLVPAVELAASRFSRRLLEAVDSGLAFRADDRPQSVADWVERFPDHHSRHAMRPEVRTEALERGESSVESYVHTAMEPSSRFEEAVDFEATTIVGPVSVDREYLDRRMLVVDDDRGARTLARRVLENLGVAHVDEAADGAAALACFDDARAVPDVVLCDLEMRPMDGIELLRHLAERSVRAALILLGDSDERMLSAVEHLAGRQGLTVLGGLRKPVTPDAIARLLARLDLVPGGSRDGQPAPVLEVSDEELREGIAADALELVYLPKVSLREHDLLGAEALVRWPVAGGEGVAAGALVDRVAALGLADAFTEQVLRKALAQAGQWRATGLPCTLSVNMFAASLGRLDLPQRLVALAQEEGVAPGDVVLEVAELDFQRQSAVPMEVLARLRLNGVGVSLDDFGTGSLSLERLRYIPFTELKVDRSFVASAGEERTSRVILESSVALARRLGVSVVAEGVADAQGMEMVSRLGFDTAQGFAISPPMAGERLREWSRDWSVGRTVVTSAPFSASA
jgi:EAL domain-containing protein (putative c-di-GMP-specific phosphodiesterase class I)/ActR/RegA family two-component response regulator